MLIRIAPCLAVCVLCSSVARAGAETSHYLGRTSSSEDTLARLPLGTLWWGGPGPARTVSRHWRAPVPLFSNGILYVEGQHDVIAVDAYNGREMWNRHLENVGRFPPFYRGGNIVADDDSVFSIQGLTCLRLDGRTGKTLRECTFPLDETHERQMVGLPGADPDQAEPGRVVWEFLAVSGNRILGTLGNEGQGTPKQVWMPKTPQQSKYLFASDGRLLWEKKHLEGVGYSALGKVLRHSFIVGDTAFLPWAYDLHTGRERLLRKDPLTGQAERFTLPGKSFCGTVAAASSACGCRATPSSPAWTSWKNPPPPTKR